MKSSPGRVDARVSRLTPGFRVFVLGALFATLGLMLAPGPEMAFAAGPNAIMTPNGYDANSVPVGDDTFNTVAGLPFTMNWNGTTTSQIHINMNGNVTFGTDFTTFDPATALGGLGRDIIAPFWADVDTRNPVLGHVTYSDITPGSVPLVDGHKAFFVNWVDVGRFNYVTAGNTQTNSFQLVIVERADTGAGNFDFMFNYDAISWDLATASSTRRARVGWGRADGTSFELPGSGIPAAGASVLLDSSPAATSLIQNSLNSAGQLGRYVWQVRAGASPNLPPIVTVADRTLEGNAPGSYLGYTGAGDASASDPDGSIASFANDLPTLLPLGTRNVLWTATDDRGEVTTATQTVTVADTTPPVLPLLTSPTHTAGVWTSLGAVTVNSSVSTDVCSGVAGLSYVWSRDITATPDATPDPSIPSTYTVSLVTTSSTTVVDEPFSAAAIPSDWNPSTAWIRTTGAVGRYNSAPYAVEVFDDSNSAARRQGSISKTFDLSGFTSATLTFWDSHSKFSNPADQATVDYSVDGGANWIVLQTSTTAASPWTLRTYQLQPVTANVTIRFNGSVSAIAEYVNWDDIKLVGHVTSTTTLSNVARSVSSSDSFADGTWYFNLRAVDNAGNWTATGSFGPVLIDSAPPATTCSAPSGWSTSTVNASLVASDAGSGVAFTRYKLDAAAVATYTAAIPISAEGTHTLLYWSTDQRGNVETTSSATVRVDTTSPTVPASFSASAVSTSAVEVNWAASTDAVSGVFGYGVYRDGSLIATSAATTYVMSGLNPGQTYGFSVAALDVAGNWSAQTASKDATLPASEIWMSLSPTSIDFGAIDPGTSSAVTTGTVVTIGGVGALNYDFTCSAEDFSNLTTPTATPTMPIGVLSYAVRGWKDVTAAPFTTSAVLLDTGIGSSYVWEHPYVFDYTLDMPWAFEPGAYATSIRFTAVPR